MKYRIKLTQLITVILLVIAKPADWTLFTIGMLLAFAGEGIRVWASGNLKKDKNLAINGPYRMVRNPLYVGSFLMSIGLAVTCINAQYPWRSVALFAVILLGFKYIYRLQVQAEEIHLTNLFGADFENFKKTVPPYMPKLCKFGEAMEHNSFEWPQVVYNKELTTISGVVIIGALLALEIYLGKYLGDLLHF